MYIYKSKILFLILFVHHLLFFYQQTKGYEKHGYQRLNDLQNIRNNANNLAIVNLPILEQKKEKLIEKLNSQEKITVLLYLGGSFFLLIISYINILIIRKKLDLFINTHIKSIVLDKKSKEVSQIPPKVVTMVKRKLKTFEEKNGFLNQDMTQQSLAKKLGTNSSYLSMIINNEKGVNFSTYLKDLRITYAINTLKANPEMASKYTLKSLSKTFGFKSADSLARAIADKTGVNASSYLKSLEKQI